MINCVFKAYNDPPNSTNLLSSHPYNKWQKSDIRAKLKPLRMYSQFYNKFCANIKIPTNQDDPKLLRDFVKKYWLPFINELYTLNILQDCRDHLSSLINRLTINFKFIDEELAQITETADLLISNNDVKDAKQKLCIASYICNNRACNYYIYAEIATSGPNVKDKHDSRRDLMLFAKKNDRSPELFFSIVAKYEEDANLLTPLAPFKKNILQAFTKVEDAIIADIKQNQNLTTSDNRLKDLLYTRKLFNDNIQEIAECIEPTLILDEDIELLQDWNNFLKEQEASKPKEVEINSDPVDVKIQMPYSYIESLNKIIRKCHEKKQKFKFERIAKLIKKAINNQDILQALNNLCNIHATLVATYYYKLIEKENDIDETQVGGIIAEFNSTYLAVPAIAYSRFTSALQEYTRVKDEQKNRSFFTKIKDKFDYNNLGDSLNAVFRSNFTIEEIAKNPFVDKDKALYKYVTTQIKGIKVFNSFGEANNYMKDYTRAQHIKLEPNYSHFSSQQTKTQDRILQLTITFDQKNDLYYDLCNFVNNKDNQAHILNLEEVKRQLNRVP